GDLGRLLEHDAPGLDGEWARIHGHGDVALDDEEARPEIVGGVRGGNRDGPRHDAVPGSPRAQRLGDHGSPGEEEDDERHGADQAALSGGPRMHGYPHGTRSGSATPVP